MRIAHIYNNKVRDIYEQFESLEEIASNMPSNMTFVSAPNHVTVGWTYSDGEFHKPTQEGFEYDIQDGKFYPHDQYREILHQRTSNDTLQALRKLREGDQSYDWQTWLDKLDSYNKAIEDSQLQETYPDKVVYPEYPQRENE